MRLLASALSCLVGGDLFLSGVTHVVRFMRIGFVGGFFAALCVGLFSFVCFYCSGSAALIFIFSRIWWSLTSCYAEVL